MLTKAGWVIRVASAAEVDRATVYRWLSDPASASAETALAIAEAVEIFGPVPVPSVREIPDSVVVRDGRFIGRAVEVEVDDRGTVDVYGDPAGPLALYELDGVLWRVAA